MNEPATKRRSLVGVLWGVSLGLISSLALAQANPEPVLNLAAAIDPSSPIAPFSDKTASATLVLINKGSANLKVRLEAYPLRLKGGTSVAALTFAKLGSKDAVHEVSLLAAPATGKVTEVDVLVAITGMEYSGTYEGSIDVVVDGPPSKRTRVPLAVTRQPYSFEPVLGGAAVVNGVLTAKPLSTRDSIFWFTVTNPRGNADIEVVVTAPKPLSGEGTSVPLQIFPEGSFQLPAGASRNVSLTLDAVNADGVLSGKVLVNDAKGSGGQKELQVVIQPAFMALCDIVKLILLVILGTLLSVIVGTGVPTLVSRQQLWRKLSSMTAIVDAAADRGSATQLALRSQLHRLEFLAHDIFWFSPRAVDTLADISKEADDFGTRVNIVARANELRTAARDSGTIPVSVVPGLERILDNVIKYSIAGNVADAQKALEQAQSIVNDAGLSESVRKSLADRISELPASGNFVDNSDSGMRKRLDLLKDDLQLLVNPVSNDTLIRMDQECFAAHLYFIRYLSGVMLSQSLQTPYKDFAEELLKHLRRGLSGVWQANDLIRNLELGVLPSDIDAAFSNKAVDIIATPAAPRFFDMVGFLIEFSQPQINESPLVKSLDVKWDFGDGPSAATGLRCLHFFKAESFKARWSKVPVTRNVCAKTGKHNITLRLDVSGVSIFTILALRSELVSTVTVLLGAVGLALITHQGDMHRLASIQDYINPFLWGFGLDQMKGLVGKR